MKLEIPTIDPLGESPPQSPLSAKLNLNGLLIINCKS